MIHIKYNINKTIKFIRHITNPNKHYKKEMKYKIGDKVKCYITIYEPICAGLGFKYPIKKYIKTGIIKKIKGIFHKKYLIQIDNKYEWASDSKIKLIKEDKKMPTLFIQ